jgi:hypothetical protein
MDGGLLNKEVKRIYGGGRLAGVVTTGKITTLILTI